MVFHERCPQGAEVWLGQTRELRLEINRHGALRSLRYGALFFGDQPLVESDLRVQFRVARERRGKAEILCAAIQIAR